MAAREGYDYTVEYHAETEGLDINVKDCDGVCEAILLTVY